MDRDVVETLARSLTVPRWRRGAITRELRSHLEETREDLVTAGWQPEEAMREASSRLGDASEIAIAFGEVYRPSRSTKLGLALALSTGMLLSVWGVSGTLASTASGHHSHPHASSVHQSRPATRH